MSRGLTRVARCVALAGVIATAHDAEASTSTITGTACLETDGNGNQFVKVSGTGAEAGFYGKDLALHEWTWPQIVQVAEAKKKVTVMISNGTVTGFTVVRESVETPSKKP